MRYWLPFSGRYYRYYYEDCHRVVARNKWWVFQEKNLEPINDRD